MKIQSVAAAALLFALAGASLAAADRVRDFWFNGAEISRYALDQSRYGQQHPGHAEFIFVTEPFLIKEQVKHESGAGASTPALKLNALRTFNTGIYSYRTMTSTFRPIDLNTYPHALKSTTSVQDWCGQAFQQINRSETGWAVELRSYFQKEADRDFELPDAILEDELWLLVRLDPQQLPVGALEVVPGALYTRFNHKSIEAHAANGTLSHNRTKSRYALHYPELERTLTIDFDSKFPHIIRAWTETDPGGTTRAVLENRIMNSSYWSENQPGDRDKRKSLGLEPIAD
jgi:hypothetical protein